MSARSVESLVQDIHLLGEKQYQLIQAVRALVSKTFKTCTEEVKYGGILFSVEGVQFGGVFAYKEHVSVEFSRGADIADPFGHLQGAGKGRRHLKLRAVEDIEFQKLASYLLLALEAAKRGLRGEDHDPPSDNDIRTIS